MLELVLYGRPACHLCDEMADEVAEALHGRAYRLTVEDVDTRPEWRNRFGPRVPVLTLSDGTELCHYYLDPDKLRTLR
ncbi:MAG: glutaredoxin family protein [Nevskiales bacterium]